jgi:UDP-GlcNAc3NAcA epimerase
MKTIFHIVGNRPQFVKLAVLYKELNANINQQIIHTGQHFSHNMSQLFFEDLKIPKPTINFNIQHPNRQAFIQQASQHLYEYFTQHTNAVILVYGDTNTTLAGAWAAKKANLPLLHFEAGVRTLDNEMPEEINRIETDNLADVNYCCTQNNFDVLEKENIEKKITIQQIINTGDLMLDAFVKINPSLTKHVFSKQYIVCTIHREANVNSKENLMQIVQALNTINKNIEVVMPLHPNTKNKIAAYNLKTEFTILDALGYPEMKSILSNCAYVITDSGGTSREAFFLQKKSLIIMNKPFWPEIIQLNCALSTIANTKTIVEKFEEMVNLNADFTKKIFGEGNAAKKIHKHLNNFL